MIWWHVANTTSTQDREEQGERQNRIQATDRTADHGGACRAREGQSGTSEGGAVIKTERYTIVTVKRTVTPEQRIRRALAVPSSITSTAL